jgi:putative hemolysin
VRAITQRPHDRPRGDRGPFGALARGTAGLVAFVLLAPVALIGCGAEDEGPTGVANPASVFCEEQGGRVEIERDVDGGERGICVLPDGTRIDEWEYWRQQHTDPEEGASPPSTMPSSKATESSTTTTTASPPATRPPTTGAPSTTTTAPAVAQAARELRRGPTDRHLVALTFDAGSDAGSAARILDVLAAERVSASFGITGAFADAHPELVRRMATEGHHLMNHSYDHPSFTGYSTGTGALDRVQRQTSCEGPRTPSVGRPAAPAPSRGSGLRSGTPTPRCWPTSPPPDTGGR